MCAANINDKWRKYKSRFSTTLSTTIGTGVSDTLTPATVTGLPTDTAITLMIDRVDSTGARTPTKLELIKGIVSGGNLTSYVRAVEGTEQQHTGGAVIEMVWNAADWNDAVDSFLAGHTQAGAHVSALPLTSPVLTTPKVVTSINDANGNEVIKTPATTSAVNEVTITNSATGNAVQIGATGDDTNIDLKLVPKGTGGIQDKNGDYLAPNYSMARQALINGNFDVFQLVNFASKTTSGYCLDEWYAAVGGTVTITQQSTGAPAGSSNVVRVAYNAASSFANLCQALEMVDAKKFWGKKVTASVKLRRNSAFAANIALKIQKNSTGDVMTSGTWSDIGLTTILNANLPTGNASTDWVNATVTVTVPSDGSANGLRVVIGESAAGGNGEYYEASQAQLCVGDVALPFQPKSFNDELLACMRQFEKSYDYTSAPGANDDNGTFQSAAHTAIWLYQRHIPYKVAKRAIVTPTIYSSTGASGKIRDVIAAADRTAGVQAPGMCGFTVYGAGMTIGNEHHLHWVADARL